MKVSDYITEYLILNKVSHVFGVSGANIEDLFSAIHKNKEPKIILAKNEYNAATMAIGSYLSSLKVSVVMTTSGPGVLNTLPILAEAYTSKIPLVLISGIVPEEMEGLGAFQDTSGKGGSINILEMLKPCSCFQIKITDENMIPKALDLAFKKSKKNRKPSVILIPKNIFNKEIYHIEKFEDQADIKELNIDLVKVVNFCNGFTNSSKVPPLIVLGEELIHLENIEIITKFIQQTGSSVALTPNSKGLFNHNDPMFLGIIGIMGHSTVDEYLKKTDYLILIGVNFDLLNRFGLQSLLPLKKILIINVEKSHSIYSFKDSDCFEVYGPINNIVEVICLKINSTKILTKVFVDKNEKKEKYEDKSVFNYKNIVEEIQSLIDEDEDGNVFVDAGNSGAFVIHHLKPKGKGLCYVSLGMGGMGNSIGAGIGSAVVSKKRSYVFLGDGSFLMHGMEIHTAVEYNLPIIFFIFNNNSHGMCSTRENVFLGGESGINNFRYCNISDGIGGFFPGINSYNITNIESLKNCVESISVKMSPCVVTINTSNDEATPFKSFVKN